MRVTARELINIMRARLGERGIRPIIHNPKDKAYWLPTRAKIEAILRLSRINKLQYITDLWDCDDFELLVRAEMLYSRYYELRTRSASVYEVPHDIRCNYAYGQAICEGHTLGIVTTVKGLYLVSGQTDRIWRPTLRDGIKEIWP